MLIFIFLPLGGLGYTFWNFLGTPAQGIIEPVVVEEQASAEPKKEYIRYQGEYLSFSHEATYQEKRHEISENTPIKEQIVLSKSDREPRKIAVTVRERGGEGFASDPSFQYREKHPEEYLQRQVEKGNLREVLFSKNSQVFEETAFLLHENLLVSVSLTSPINNEGLAEELAKLLASLEWRPLP